MLRHSLLHDSEQGVCGGTRLAVRLRRMGHLYLLCWCGNTCPDCEDGPVLLWWCRKPRSEKRDLGHPASWCGSSMTKTVSIGFRLISFSVFRLRLKFVRCCLARLGGRGKG